MIRHETEIAIIGAGFSGSLLALILQRLDRKVVLLERGAHPRFAVGESSTPLANLSLENLCRQYDLPRLMPFGKYGSWQQTYPALSCGLKRGFSFFRQEPQQKFLPQADHANELLVAASPNDEVGDTHWFREQFDDFFVREVKTAGIPYYDQTEITKLQHPRGWLLQGHRGDDAVEIKARFLIDASGSSSILARALDMDCRPQNLHTRSWSVYSHFTNVGLWGDSLQNAGGSLANHPFHCDDAALHHILDDGWMWVLRFNNGVTSAGIVFNAEKLSCSNTKTPDEIWGATLQRYPAIAEQFSQAERIRPLIVTPRLQRRAPQAAGEDWVMLPHSAYFIDPLLSSGNAHALLAIDRLARLIDAHWERPSFTPQLLAYNAKLQREINFIDLLVHGCYLAFTHFPLLAAYSMYYFTGAIYSETRRRQGAATGEDEFLFSHHPPFRAAVEDGYKTLFHLSKKAPLSFDEISAFQQKVARDIAPYNLAGLGDPAKQNMYPFV